MFASGDTVDLIMKWFALTAIVFTVADILLVRTIKIGKPLLENKYFNFHRRHGFFKITILKILLVVITVSLLLSPGINKFYLVLVIIVYVLVIIRLSIDFIRKN